MHSPSDPSDSANPAQGSLTAADRTKQRNETATELVKALLVINGGGAVALLAFLQAIWTQHHTLAKPTAIGIALLALGALLAASFHIFRHQASISYQFGTTEQGQRYDCLYLVAAWLSLAAFFIGIVVVVAGVLCAV